MSDETMQQSAQQPAQQPEAESTDLTVSDLNAMKTIIDLASSRGAFKANEMVAVGTIYNKLSTFLSSITKQPQTGA
jgi:hypothetical protein